MRFLKRGKPSRFCSADKHAGHTPHFKGACIPHTSTSFPFLSLGSWLEVYGRSNTRAQHPELANERGGEQLIAFQAQASGHSASPQPSPSALRCDFRPKLRRVGRRAKLRKARKPPDAIPFSHVLPLLPPQVASLIDGFNLFQTVLLNCLQMVGSAAPATIVTATWSAGSSFFQTRSPSPRLSQQGSRWLGRPFYPPTGPDGLHLSTRPRSPGVAEASRPSASLALRRDNESRLADLACVVWVLGPWQEACLILLRISSSIPRRIWDLVVARK